MDELNLDDLTLGWRLTFVDTIFEHTVSFASSRCRALNFSGCRFLGGLVATATHVIGNLTMTGCVVSGSAPGRASRRPAAIWLTDAEVSGRVDIADTVIGNEANTWSRSVHAERLKVGATIRLVDGVVANGEVKLTGAVIGGSVLVYGAKIRDRYVALYLSETTIGGNLSVMGDRAGGASTIDGGLVVSGCTVAGQFLVHASTIRAPSQEDDPRYRYRGARPGVAIDGARARFDGDVRIYGGSRVVGSINLATARVESQLDLDDTSVVAPESGWRADTYSVDLGNAKLGSDLRFRGRTGSIRLENANVSGSIHFEYLVVSANQPEAIEARNVRVEGDVWLDRATVNGGDTDFRLSHVSGDWRAPGARLVSTGAVEDRVLTMTSTEVDGSVFLSRGFEAVGLVRLNRCRIGGRLTFDGASIRSAPHAPFPLVVACRSATVASGLFLDWEVDGAVDFQGTATNLLVDDPTRWGSGHSISGLTYERMNPIESSDREPSTGELTQRLRWLADQNEPDAGTYSQLADYYRRHGRTVDAEQVLIARNRFLRSERRTQGGWRNRVKNVADLAWDISVGYGYRASRAALVIIVLIALVGAILAGSFARHRLVAVDDDNAVFSAAEACESETVRCYNPVFYAIDTVVPLVDLQQRSTWYVSRNQPYGTALEWGLNLTVLLGWAASSALVLGLTRTLNPGS